MVRLPSGQCFLQRTAAQVLGGEAPALVVGRGHGRHSATAATVVRVRVEPIAMARLRRVRRANISGL